MPLMNGLDATKKIRMGYKNVGMIIGTSGDCKEEIEHKCKEAGMNEICNSYYYL